MFGSSGSRKSWNNSPFFRAPEKKDFLFFFCGATSSRTVPQPSPAGCFFSTRKSRSEVPERGDFGEENCLGKGAGGQSKKRKKGCTKKGGIIERGVPQRGVPLGNRFQTQRKRALILRNGPNTTTTILELISRNPIFHF